MANKIPARLRPYLRIGTCSWKFESWKGLFYDEGKKYRADDYLADYARHLDSVEVDQWFWSLFPAGVKLPDRASVERYSRSVPEDFIFTIKAPNALTLTHYYARQPKAYASFAGRPNPNFLSTEILEKFLDTLAPMGKKLGPVMFQFEYLNKKKMAGRDAFLDRFHEFMARAPRGVPYAVETRNPNYLSKAFFDFLKEHGLGFVYLEGYYMPPIGEVFEKFRPETADFAVVRLHGGDRMEIEKETDEKWNRVVAPKPEGVRAAAAIVDANAKRKIRTFVNVNNHFEGSSPLTIARLLKEL